MNTLQKILGIGSLIVALSGCAEPEKKFLEGKVLMEKGNVAGIVESSGALFGNESVKFGNPTYILIVETNQGTHTIYVRDRYEKPVEALSAAIEVGDRIKFKTGSYNGLFESSFKPYFSQDKIGSVPSNEIELIEKVKRK